MCNLVIDTSTKFLYLALVKDNEILSEKVFEGSKNHAGNSVYQLEIMLKENNLTVDDLTGIYCGKGPGSYTGLRISVTIAKMLASFKNIKLFSVSSLYLAGSGYDNKNVAVLFDARRGNSFCACFGETSIHDKLRDTKEFLSQVLWNSNLTSIINTLEFTRNRNENLITISIITSELKIC